MALSSTDLADIRAEIGSSTPPTDDDLRAMYADLRHWLPVAIRVLKTRRAEIIAGGVDQITVANEITVRTNLVPLDRAIADLEIRWAALNPESPSTGISVGRLVRADGVWR